MFDKTENFQFYEKVVIMNFWNRLRSELEYQGITHKELAEKINIQKATLEARFLRENTPDADFLYKCSKTLNLTMDYLYTGNNFTGLNDDEMEVVRLYKTCKDENKAAIKQLLAALSLEK